MDVGRWYVRRGRLSREGWWLQYVLPSFLAALLAGWLDQALGMPVVDGSGEAVALVGDPRGPIRLLVELTLIVPTVSAAVARLHDQGDSAWRLLILLIPILGVLLLLVLLFVFGGDRVPNRYGPAPAPLRLRRKPAQRPTEQALETQRR